MFTLFVIEYEVSCLFFKPLVNSSYTLKYLPISVPYALGHEKRVAARNLHLCFSEPEIPLNS